MAPLTFGERIALIRKRRDMTQQALAAQIGTTQTEIYRLEKGVVKDPHMSRVKALAQHLQVSTDWLMGLKDMADEGAPTAPAPQRPRARTAAPVG